MADISAFKVYNDCIKTRTEWNVMGTRFGPSAMIILASLIAGFGGLALLTYYTVGFIPLVVALVIAGIISILVLTVKVERLGRMSKLDFIDQWRMMRQTAKNNIVTNFDDLLED